MHLGSPSVRIPTNYRQFRSVLQTLPFDTMSHWMGSSFLEQSSGATGNPSLQTTGWYQSENSGYRTRNVFGNLLGTTSQSEHLYVQPLPASPPTRPTFGDPSWSLPPPTTMTCQGAFAALCSVRSPTVLSPATVPHPKQSAQATAQTLPSLLQESLHGVATTSARVVQSTASEIHPHPSVGLANRLGSTKAGVSPVASELNKLPRGLPAELSCRNAPSSTSPAVPPVLNRVYAKAQRGIFLSPPDHTSFRRRPPALVHSPDAIPISHLEQTEVGGGSNLRPGLPSLERAFPDLSSSQFSSPERCIQRPTPSLRSTKPIGSVSPAHQVKTGGQGVVHASHRSEPEKCAPFSESSLASETSLSLPVQADLGVHPVPSSLLESGNEHSVECLEPVRAAQPERVTPSATAEPLRWPDCTVPKATLYELMEGWVKHAGGLQIEDIGQGSPWFALSDSKSMLPHFATFLALLEKAVQAEDPHSQALRIFRSQASLDTFWDGSSDKDTLLRVGSVVQSRIKRALAFLRSTDSPHSCNTSATEADFSTSLPTPELQVSSPPSADCDLENVDLGNPVKHASSPNALTSPIPPPLFGQSVTESADSPHRDLASTAGSLWPRLVLPLKFFIPPATPPTIDSLFSEKVNHPILEVHFRSLHDSCLSPPSLQFPRSSSLSPRIVLFIQYIPPWEWGANMRMGIIYFGGLWGYGYGRQRRCERSSVCNA